jgi:hypothetical protein
MTHNTDHAIDETRRKSERERERDGCKEGREEDSQDEVVIGRNALIFQVRYFFKALLDFLIARFVDSR